MDSKSQASADDIINLFSRSCSCSCSTLSDATFCNSSGCCAKDIVDKLMDKLEEKDKQLEKNKKANEELLANLEKARAVQAIPGTDELKTELAIAHKIIIDLQMAFWKCFPSPHLCYNIKIKVPSTAGSGGCGYLYAYCDDYLYSSTGDDDHKGYFKFEKDSDGTVTIYSKSRGKYLQIQTSSGRSAASVDFCANLDNKSKFALIFQPHPQQQDKQLPGILVDIFSLANRCFLSVKSNPINRLVIVSNSPTAPANKFLILAGDEE